MGMLDAPNRRPVITQNYSYFQSQIGSNMTASDIENLMSEIQNSIDISDDEEIALRAQLQSVAMPIENIVSNDKVVNSQKDFATWYMSNLVVISVVQWLFIFFFVMKNSK